VSPNRGLYEINDNKVQSINIEKQEQFCSYANQKKRISEESKGEESNEDSPKYKQD
jgi:hypothetical protein